ncbi:MAG TPA: NACHT domain-containing protein [Pyrinomonadaceae bacterium]|nr:NACHT domain-containing protein [Pyrinomonadaceae bacterium]
MLILPITPRQLGFLLDFPDLSNLRNELIWGPIAGLIIAILVKAPLRRLLRSLIPYVIEKIADWVPVKVVGDEVAGRQIKEEQAYLRWRKAHLQPLHDKRDQPISIPATKKERQKDQSKKPRPRLTRHDASDWEHPLLKEMGLAYRDEFGQGSRVRNLVQELKDHSVTIVLGEPGSGKSVCLRQLVRDLCKKELDRGGRPRMLPIFVEMKAYDGWDYERNKPQPVLDFLTNSFESSWSKSQEPQTHSRKYIERKLREILQQGRAILIFDALDEMPQNTYQQRTDELREFMTDLLERGEGNRFVFSCRQLDYDKTLPMNEVVIEPFDQKRIKQYLEKYLEKEVAEDLAKQIKKSETLTEIVSNPFLLHAFTLLQDNHPGKELPAARGELIRDYTTELLKLLEEDQQEELASIDGGLPRLQTFFSALAFELQQEGTSAHPDSLLHLWTQYPQWKQMVSIGRRAFILRGDNPGDPDPAEIESYGRIEFQHHRLQEYFAAQELANRYNWGEVVDHYLRDIWWHETVLFAIAEVDDKQSVIKRMLSLRKETEGWIEDVLARAKDPYAKKDEPEEVVTNNAS